ncbi:MAG: serine/threonine protein kinase [Deltaproteobacteria bacterium]|nr:serine/threonine protein kinase [Deltaproteobacteria bacterium]
MMATRRMTELEAGDVLGERFRIERFLGKGGMATVLAATDLETGRRVALKVMRSMHSGDQTLLERFRREAEVLRKIDHHAVVGVEDAGELPGGNFFIALELLEGETLKRFVSREIRVPLPLLVPVVEGLSGALTAAHAAGVVHRDIKPSNIFLPAGPEKSLSLRDSASLVKLVDFGVAKIAGAAKLTITGGSVGTFKYMSPEQLRGTGDVDHRADIYALGVVAYEALSGEHPFASDKTRQEVVQMILNGDYPRLRKRRPELPKSVALVVAKAMHHERGLRYQTAEEFSRDFTRAVFEFLSRPTRPAPTTEADPLLHSGRPTMPAKVTHDTQPPDDLPASALHRPRALLGWLVAAVVIAAAAAALWAI